MSSLEIFRFGQSFTLDTGFEFSGFLRPLESHTAESLSFRETAGITGEKYMLIAPPGVIGGERDGMSLFCGDAEYEILRTEKKFVGGDQTHSESLLRRLGGRKGA